MAYRNKTYVCFDADNDIEYYKEMCKWKADDDLDFNFYDAHDLNNLRDGSLEETIKRKLRERFNDTKLLIVLIGTNTKYHYKYVRWEIEVALKMQIPIIGVNICNNATKIEEYYPAILREELILNTQFNQKILQYSIDNWIKEAEMLNKMEEKNNRIWKQHIYDMLG
ncbi:MAG: TIR domain-containing protein [Labilibaculum sp.]|nr:TIR domain-containing protein [Labilibaculum sp.]